MSGVSLKEQFERRSDSSVCLGGDTSTKTPGTVKFEESKYEQEDDVLSATGEEATSSIEENTSSIGDSDCEMSIEDDSVESEGLDVPSGFMPDDIDDDDVFDNCPCGPIDTKSPFARVFEPMDTIPEETMGDDQEEGGEFESDSATE